MALQPSLIYARFEGLRSNAADSDIQSKGFPASTILIEYWGECWALNILLSINYPIFTGLPPVPTLNGSLGYNKYFSPSYSTSRPAEQENSQIAFFYL
jgi:hypothetical protein